MELKIDVMPICHIALHDSFFKLSSLFIYFEYINSLKNLICEE
jgi:hypothetical protein